MINQKTAALIIASCFIIYTFYYNFHDNYFYKLDINFDALNKVRKKEPIYIYNGTEDFLINTNGCYIPNYGKTFVFREPRMINSYCGDRAVFIKKIANYKIEFRINEKILNKYSKNVDTQCYYNFASRSKTPGSEDTKLNYTDWTSFKNGTTVLLLQEVVTVKCNTTSATNFRAVYEDAYVFVKKLETEKPKSEEKRWNVLLVGMDTMSRARAVSSMPRTVHYLQRHGWLDYKGYQKVGYNTFPNIMAFLTGKKMGTIYQKCAKGMSRCNDIFIWSKFRNESYHTAYGEDSLKLPDTFSRYNGFQIQPTDHYLRPFFLTGENELGNVRCAKHLPSAVHLLNYAYDFANTYKEENFFGAFWINSYSHNLNHIPTLLENDMIRFFRRLNESDILNNTIVIFTSDHGIRYGKMRLPIESFYEERLPMLFVWIPPDFRQKYEEKYHNLQVNQNRLVTPYDLYLTLEEVRENFKTTTAESEACPKCSSLFRGKSPYRTCADAGVIKKWCSCHDMIKVDLNDAAVENSLHLAVDYIQSIANSVKTTKCKACHPLVMKTVIRTHSYVDSSDNKTHYVIAWRMAPGAVSFEATVMKEDNNFTIVQPTHTISEYNRLGNCVVNANDRQFCVCKSSSRNCS